MVGPINDHVASFCNCSVIISRSEDQKKIFLYINSPGGLVTSGLGIYDTMQYQARCFNLLHWSSSKHGIIFVSCGNKG